MKGRLYKGFAVRSSTIDYTPRPFYWSAVVSVNGHGAYRPELQRTFRARTRERADAKARSWLKGLE